MYDALPRDIYLYLLNTHVEVWEASLVTWLYIGDGKERVSITDPGPDTKKKIDKLIDILQTLREHDVEDRPIFKQMTFLAQGQENHRNRKVLSLDKRDSSLCSCFRSSLYRKEMRYMPTASTTATKPRKVYPTAD